VLKIAKRPDRIKFNGRILFLTDDTALIRKQLEEGENLSYDPSLALMNNISTDEITPGWVCFYYDETLGQYVYVGMREQAVQKDEVKNGGFAVVVSGLSKGCGSSRETAPYAEKWAGIELVIAQTIEKIYGQNSQNIGLLTSTDFRLIERSKSLHAGSTPSRNQSSNTAASSITTRRGSRAKFRHRHLRHGSGR
jgi:3-isopropylmalate/(R)-2-methylmalate dehydratase large subunit